MEQMTATEWSTVRDYYTELLAEQKEQHGRMQADVAAAGGLSGQNAISKIISNHHLGPSVETFLKAVVGLGLRPSAFFLQLEQRLSSPSSLNVSSSSQRRRESPAPRLAHRRPRAHTDSVTSTVPPIVNPPNPLLVDLVYTIHRMQEQLDQQYREQREYAQRLDLLANGRPDDVSDRRARVSHATPKQRSRGGRGGSHSAA